MFSRKNKKKSAYADGIAPLSIRKFSKEQVLYNEFILKKVFVWQDKQIYIIPTSSHKAQQSSYIGMHTGHGTFYLEQGIEWIQSVSGIYIEHEDEDTQKWLMQCAFERISKQNNFPIEITSISLHHYLNPSKYEAISLKGLFNSTLHASTKDWITLFSAQKFLNNANLSIDNLNLHRNIVLGRQNISYLEYRKLRSGNIILLNDTNFSIDGTGLFSFGSFAMQVLYNEQGLIFQEWNTNMKDKEEHSDDWNLEEYEESNLDEDQEEESNENHQAEEAVHHQEESSEQIVQDEPTHPFADVPIKLTFSLGQLNLSVAQIMQLQEGSVLQLEKTTPVQVAIYANNKSIGSGEVVEVEGVLGVQITNLNR